jgi:hypothetical protein
VVGIVVAVVEGMKVLEKDMVEVPMREGFVI